MVRWGRRSVAVAVVAVVRLAGRWLAAAFAVLAVGMVAWPADAACLDASRFSVTDPIAGTRLVYAAAEQRLLLTTRDGRELAGENVRRFGSSRRALTLVARSPGLTIIANVDLKGGRVRGAAVERPSRTLAPGAERRIHLFSARCSGGSAAPAASPTGAATATAVASATPTAIPAQADQAVAYQINPAHDGVAGGNRPMPPLIMKWSVDLGGTVSYPLIAGGKVYVTVASAPDGVQLRALDAATGRPAWGPVELPARYERAHAAYDAGTVFVSSFEGVVRAFDATTGASRWTHKLPDTVWLSAPVAVQGSVLVSAHEHTYALDAADGRIRWRGSAPISGGKPPSLSPDGVFVPNSCQLIKLDRATGAQLWGHFDLCSSGSGEVAPYRAGRVYANMQGTPAGYVIDASNGEVLRRIASSGPPAFRDSVGFFPSGTKLVALDLATGTEMWSFEAGARLAPPIVVGAAVYVGTESGDVLALDARSGTELWRDQLGAPMNLGSALLPGLNAGEGLLVVPAGSLLIAYEGS